MSEPTAPVPALPEPADGDERRVWVRYPRRLHLLWQRPGETGREMLPARVYDLSRRGVGMIFDREFPAGTVLLVRLPTSTLGWTSHVVRVRHVEAHAPGEFRVGCSFAKPLPAAVLRALLQ